MWLKPTFQPSADEVAGNVVSFERDGEREVGY
jgi:hypothetical protein